MLWGCNLQDVSGKVGLAGVKLAPLAGAYDFAGVRDRGRPVKALAERIANEGARRRMMAADPGVDVPQELAPLGDGHAPCKMPEVARLYSSPSTRETDLAILAMRLAAARSVGSSPRAI
jgi:hypothetical protein